MHNGIKDHSGDPGMTSRRTGMQKLNQRKFEKIVTEIVFVDFWAEYRNSLLVHQFSKYAGESEKNSNLSKKQMSQKFEIVSDVNNTKLVELHIGLK